jgi:hypothetical protein
MKAYRIVSLLAGAVMFAVVARAADDTRTITGEAMCAKCELKLQDKCQTVIQVKEGDKTVLYYVEGNSVGKAFHSQVCDAPAEATATGTVATVDGKLVLTPTSIELKK